ncbi:hypothetical protein NQ176_g9277 [Zarea fungicola]|uniref:Uncharacterized protein n=1 Tax=Zarea fungicola TaxID=93591 RepID=A0ACC1MNZ1_9HYPO|nr:hypothetical protein NQ176_g9277 [Lecanicillium fungicola]
MPSSITLLGDSPSPESAIPRRRSFACPVKDLQGMGESLAGDAVMPDTSAWNMPAYPYQVFMPEGLEGNVADKSINQSLSQRSRTISQGSLTAKILLGQITEYPRMMISGHQLPPFIYPPCSKFSRRLFTTCDTGLDAETLGMTRNSWIITESLRRKRIRAGCLLYIIDSLFHVDIRSPSKGTCPEVIPLPLPCYRELWAYISDKEWEKRYQLHIATQKKRGRSGVTVGDLLLLKYSVRQSDGADNSIDGLHFTEELAEWCQKGDEFSAFLWMAFMMSS